MSKPFVLKEADISRTCTDLLAADGWRAVRTDPVADRRRGKGFGELGMADCLYIRYSPYSGQLYTGRLDRVQAQVLWIEWKRLDAKGRATKAKPHQLAWHEAERARGAFTLIAGIDFQATIEGFAAWYELSGLKRK